MASEYDVAVVGFGPVGSALSILLAQRGWRVVVLERWPTPYPLPRAVHFDHEVARILQACGLGTELPRITEPAAVYEWRNGAGDTLLRFGRVGDSASGWPESSMFNQPELESLLDGRARSLPGVEIRRGVEVVGLRDEAEGVTLAGQPVSLARSAGGPPRTIAAGPSQSVRARHAVGCDGANSTVRALIGAPVSDLGFFYDWLIVDLVLDPPRVFDPINLQVCDPARPTTVVSGGPGRRRWEFMRLPHESREELDDEATAWRLLAAWDVTPANARLERHAVYRFQARWAERWGSGRVFLAGDAAHQMPPFAGQGMCSGLRDAANLAWKLDLVLAGRAVPALLETYGEERMPNVRNVIQFSMDLGKVICVPDAAQAAARDQAMMGAVEAGKVTEIPPLPGIESGILQPGDGLAGRLFVQGWVLAGEVRRRFDDAVGTGWRLVVAKRSLVDAVDAATAEWFAGIGGRLVAVGEGGDLADADGTYAEWFARHGVAAALQRPDFYLFGAASDAAGVAGLLRSLRAALGR